VRYIASDEVSPNEVAKKLGNAIGKNDLEWHTIANEKMYKRLVGSGFNPMAAKGLVEMNAARTNGVLYEDYNTCKPELGHVKLDDFAKEFAAVYNNTK